MEVSTSTYKVNFPTQWIVSSKPGTPMARHAEYNRDIQMRPALARSTSWQTSEHNWQTSDSSQSVKSDEDVVRVSPISTPPRSASPSAQPLKTPTTLQSPPGFDKALSSSEQKIWHKFRKIFRGNVSGTKSNTTTTPATDLKPKVGSPMRRAFFRTRVQELSGSPVQAKHTAPKTQAQPLSEHRSHTLMQPEAGIYANPGKENSQNGFGKQQNTTRHSNFLERSKETSSPAATASSFDRSDVPARFPYVNSLYSPETPGTVASATSTAQ